MHTTKLRKVGGSVMLAIPPTLLDTLGLAADKRVGIDVVDGELVVRPVRKRYALDDLLDQCELDTPMTDEDRAFLDGPPVGRELI
jgi:antitoxin ChpS